MRVEGVLVGVDAWVKTFAAKKARSVITDVAKLDVVSNGLLYNQLLNFCQNARMAFLATLGVTYPPLFSLSLCRRWITLLLRRCAGMELEVGMWIGLNIFANLLT